MPPADLKTFDCVKLKIDWHILWRLLLQYKRNHLTGRIDRIVCTGALKITRFKHTQKKIGDRQNGI